MAATSIPILGFFWALLLSCYPTGPRDSDLGDRRRCAPATSCVRRIRSLKDPLDRRAGRLPADPPVRERGHCDRLPRSDFARRSARATCCFRRPPRRRRLRDGLAYPPPPPPPGWYRIPATRRSSGTGMGAPTQTDVTTRLTRRTLAGIDGESLIAGSEAH